MTGPEQHQVRRWTSWHRATILSMLAHAFLAVTTATERTQRPSPTGWIRLTCNEIRHLFTAVLIAPIRDITHRLLSLATTTPTPRPTMPLPATTQTRRS